MFNERIFSDTHKMMKDNKETAIEKNSFEAYEGLFHSRQMCETDKSEDVNQNFLDYIFDCTNEEIHKVKDKVNQYLERKIASSAEIESVDADDIFSKDDFIEIIKSCSERAAGLAVVYWTLMKQSFKDYQLFRTGDNSKTEKLETETIHENRVRAVTDLLLSLNPMTTIARFAYTFSNGEEPEPILEKIDAISEKFVDAVDAALYITANIGLGCIEVVENGIEYGGAAVEYLIGNQEKAEEILNLNITGDVKNQLNQLYGRENWVNDLDDSVEKFGAFATYLGLGTLLAAGGITAVAAGAGLVLGKAGEKAKSGMIKTGELTDKEMLHGLISGCSMFAFAQFGNTAAAELKGNVSKIAKEINKIYKMSGKNMDAKLLKSTTASVVQGLEKFTEVCAYETPEELSKETERALGIDSEAKGNWIKVLKDGGTALLIASTFKMLQELHSNKEFYSTYEDRLKQTPQNNGEWTGKRGESKFISKDESVNAILEEYGIDGIKYKDAVPDFSEISKGTVEINHMTTMRRGRGGNFEQAFEKFAEQKGYSAEEIAAWMDKNHYVWHECNDMKTMMKIPFEVNHKFGHCGGVAECKCRDKMLDELLGKEHTEGGIFDV